MADRQEHVEYCSWTTKSIKSPLPQCLGLQNLAEWQLFTRESHSYSHVTLWLRGLSRSRDKLKPLYLCHHSIYDRQSWQGSDLPWGAPSHKVTWTLDHGIFRDHDNHEITITRPRDHDKSRDHDKITRSR